MAPSRSCLALLLLLAAAGCDGLPFGACTDELGVEIRPRERTIQVGEGFQATAIGTSCGGRLRWTMQMLWETPDSAVVRVERSTGRIIGVAPGTATVHAQEPPPGSFVWGSVRVTVLAR